MISLLLFVAVMVITIGYVVRNRGILQESVVTAGRGTITTLNTKLIIRIVAFFIIGALISWIQPFVAERVDFGNIGLKVKLTGSERGISDYQYKNGWVVYNSWTEQLYEFPTWQQHIEYPNDEVIAKGGLPVNIRPTFNYKIKPHKAGDMFVNLRLTLPQLEQGWLKTAIIGAMLDVSGKWTSDEIFNNREKFESEIKIEINKRLDQWFEVSNLKTHISPPAALVKSITDQAKAIKDAQTEIERVGVIKAQAEKKIATARGDSANVVIRAMGNARAEIENAKGIAEAMRLKQRELTPLYNDYIRANNWNGSNATTILGSATQVLLNK